MGVVPPRTVRRAALFSSVLACALLSGCAGAAADPGITVPTFAPSVVTTDAASAGVPLDPCAALIAPADVANVLGLDPAKTQVKSVRGQPAPAVGRTEKLDCTYTADKGRPLFTVRAATYANPEAARAQWQLNSGLEQGEKRDTTLGPATGVLFVRRSELLLSLVDGPRTLAVQVPDKTVPKGRARENLVVDLAQRALKIDPAAPAPSAAPPAAPPAAAPPPAQAGSGG
jgi:hypothetical protein